MIYLCFIGIKVLLTSKLHPFGYVDFIFCAPPWLPLLKDNVCNFARNVLLLQASPDIQQIMDLVFESHGIGFLQYWKVEDMSELRSHKGFLIKRVITLASQLWLTNMGKIIVPSVFLFLIFWKILRVKLKENA